MFVSNGVEVRQSFSNRGHPALTPLVYITNGPSASPSSLYLSGQLSSYKGKKNKARLYAILEQENNSTQTTSYRYKLQTNLTAALDLVTHYGARLNNGHSLMKSPVVRNGAELNDVHEKSEDDLQKSGNGRRGRSRGRGYCHWNDGRNEGDNDKEDVQHSIATDKIGNAQNRSQGNK